MPAFVGSRWLNGRSAAPFISLDFTTMSALPSLVTFTRGSTATYVNEAGTVTTVGSNDEPRFDHDPLTPFAQRGFLVEQASTNVLLNTATLSTQSVTTTAVSYALSFYGTGTVTKSGTATGALAGSGAAIRVQQTFTPTAGTLTLTVSGSVTKAQLETNTCATSYIPTVGTAVTRNADLASILIGSPGLTAGTVVVGIRATNTRASSSTFPAVYTLSDTSLNWFMQQYIYQPVGNSNFTNTSNGGATFDFTAGGAAIAADATGRFGSAFDSVRSIASEIGGAAAADTTARTIPVTGYYKLAIGVDQGTGNLINGCIRDLRVWSRVLPDLVLQSLTF